MAGAFGLLAKDKQWEDSGIDLYVEFGPNVPIGLEYVKIYLDLRSCLNLIPNRIRGRLFSFVIVLFPLYFGTFCSATPAMKQKGLSRTHRIEMSSSGEKMPHNKFQKTKFKQLLSLAAKFVSLYIKIKSIRFGKIKKMEKSIHNDPLIKKLSKYFDNQPIVRAYLFGSFAKDKQREDSDIDLYVEFDPNVPIGLEYVKIYLDLKELTGREVDLVTEKSISKYIKSRVEEEKILIYERQAA
ncbi:MAG: nucleotidyltransferase domain-containing protein [Phaeodactylibacter sp.]|nr:nucleotidyltransferase domain-containing protein [Phaeodactylibacter sp.]